MVVHVNRNYFARGKTGKGKFAARLVKALRKKDIEVTDSSSSRADIALHIGRMNYPSSAKKHVLRVGPACIDTNMNWRKINHEKAKSVKQADAIVYQSDYSKKIYHKLVRKPDKPEVVINNGVDPKDFEVTGWDDVFKYNFLASTRVWLPQKRLKTIIRAFRLAGIENSRLIVCGDTQGLDQKFIGNGDIYFVGITDNRNLSKLYNLCNAMIHITYVDACPNSVVEAQVAGCPVICTDQGGTKEVVKYGIVMNDKVFKYKPINLKYPPNISEKLLAEKMHVIIERFPEFSYEMFESKVSHSLHIKDVATRYISFFESIL